MRFAENIHRKIWNRSNSNIGKQEIIDAVHYHSKHMNHIFTVDTLEYLLKSGRISKTSAIAGEHGAELSEQIVGIVHGDDREAISAIQNDLDVLYNKFYRQFC